MPEFAAAPGGVTIVGTSGDDRLVGTTGDDSLVGLAGADTLVGDQGADTISGGLDNDLLDGGDSGWGWQTVNGVTTYTPPAYDIVDFRDAFRGVNVALSSELQDTRLGVDRLIGFEGVLGSAFNDSISGRLGDQEFGATCDDRRLGSILYGFGGDDLINGSLAADVLVGGDGNDILIGRTGDDLIAGQAGRDELRGDDGADSLDGGAGDDVLIGGPGNDTVTSGEGADRLALHLDGSLDRFTDFDRASDYIVLFDASGRIVADPRSVLAFDARTHLLSWDADGDTGQAPVTVAVMDGVTSLGNGNLAAGFQPTLLRLYDASGAHSDIRYAYADPSFSRTSADYNTQGLLLTYSVEFRDGSSWMKWFDSARNQVWDTLVAEYDKQGRLTTYGAYFDDGAHTVRYFDVANLQPWTRYVDEYDPQGRLLDRAVALDDGTSWEARWDVTNAQPWGYSVQSWDAAGRSQGTTYYNDDGSLFAG